MIDEEYYYNQEVVKQQMAQRKRECDNVHKKRMKVFKKAITLLVKRSNAYDLIFNSIVGTKQTDGKKALQIALEALNYATIQTKKKLGIGLYIPQIDARSLRLEYARKNNDDNPSKKRRSNKKNSNSR